jgi:tetratricopeptide (TPR) repeat protein
VAGALEHAHQQGVVHRDIKPSNLMLDARGKVWVTDFGLARVESAASLTVTGDLVGTLRYMSPEQALAKRVVIDHRTDVYSLGATLYELLTLEPVFGGKDRQELLRQIAFEEPMPPRRWNRAIPGELETIVLKALEKNPADRYATAQDFADDLERFVKDEPIRARRPSLAQRARKWARRHRGLVRTAAALALVVLLVGGALLWREQRQRDAVERAVEAGLERVEVLQEQERWDEALAVLEVAEGQLEGRGLGTLRERVKQWKRDVEMLTRLEKARLQRSAGGKETGWDDAGADRLYADAFAAYGLDVTALSPEDAAARVRASSIRNRLVAGMADWADTKDRLQQGGGSSLRVMANLVDEDPWRRRLRAAARRRDGAALERLAKEEGTWTQPPANLVLLARALRENRNWAAAERLLRRAQEEHPADFWVNLALAETLENRNPSDRGGAARFYQAALALRPRSYAVWNNLGNALGAQKRLGEAETAFRKAIALNPDFAGAYINLGNALRSQKKPAEAEAAYRKAIALQPDEARAYNNLGLLLCDSLHKPAEAEAAFRKAIGLKPDLAEAHNGLGIALREQKRLKEAEAACRRALALRPDYPEAHNGLGNALHAQKRFADAEAAYRKAIALQPDLAFAHYGLGAALHEQKKPAEAEAAYRRAIDLKLDYTEAYNNLGSALYDQKRYAEAEAAFRRAIALKRDYTEAYNGLGNALHAQKKLAEAEGAYRKAISIKPDNAVAYCNLGLALHNQKKPAEAEAAYRRAIELKPNYALAYSDLGLALLDQNKPAVAEAAYRRAIALKLDRAEAYYGLGNALRSQKKFAEAEAAFRKAIALQPDFAEAHHNLGAALRSQKRPAEAEAAFRRAIALKPDYAGAHYMLGNSLRDQRKPKEAEAAYRQAIALKLDRAEAYYGLGNALLDQKKFAEAEAAYRKAIELRPDYAGAHNNLGNTLREQKRLAEALAAFRKADQLLPNHPLIHKNLRLTERWLELDKQLPVLLAGKDKPRGPQHQIELALFCLHYKIHNRAAAGFFADAFRADPKLADDPNTGHRYNAACVAALAAAGKGKDAATLDEKERARLRRLALDWLRADLAVYTRDAAIPARRQVIGQRLAHWQQDADFAGVRGDALGKLPKAERQEWQKLWQEVEALRQRAVASPKTAKPGGS